MLRIRSRYRLMLIALLAFTHPAWAAQTLAPLPERPPAPVLDLYDLAGKPHRLAGYAGQVVIVNFWATWCPPCREEMPSMERAWQAVKGQGILLLAVNVGESQDQVWAFDAAQSLSFPVLLDEQGQTVGRWPVQGLPTTFVVDTQGRLAYRAVGGRRWDDPNLLDQVRALLR